jgi:hypothetical protein
MEIWRSPSLLGAVTHNSIAYVQLDNETEKRLAFGTAAGMYLTP